MIRSLREVYSYDIHASDGDIGRVDDFYFDDQSWLIRYLVADLSGRVVERKVLLSPVALYEPEWQHKRVPVALTRSQVKDSPDIDTTKPIARQHEVQLHQYYGWPFYWTTAYDVVGVRPLPGRYLMDNYPSGVDVLEDDEDENPNLRSIREVTHYNVQATDGRQGIVRDFIFDDNSWTIEYLVVSTRRFFGKDVLVHARHVKDITYAEATVNLSLSKARIKHAPKFDPSIPVNEKLEHRSYDYYGRPWM